MLDFALIWNICKIPKLSETSNNYVVRFKSSSVPIYNLSHTNAKPGYVTRRPWYVIFIWTQVGEWINAIRKIFRRHSCAGVETIREIKVLGPSWMWHAPQKYWQLTGEDKLSPGYARLFGRLHMTQVGLQNWKHIFLFYSTDFKINMLKLLEYVKRFTGLFCFQLPSHFSYSIKWKLLIILLKVPFRKKSLILFI